VDKQDNFSLINAFDNIKNNGDETVIDFNTHFSKTYCKIPTTIRPNVAYALNYYFEAFDGIFGIFLKNKEPQNLEEAQVATIKLEGHFNATYNFIRIQEFQLPVVKAKWEVHVTKDEPQLAPSQVPRDEQDDGPLGLDDQEPKATPLEPYAKFHEDEGENLNTQECSSFPRISDDEKFQEEEPQINQVEIGQQETSFVPIPVVVQEQLEQLPLQQEDPLLVQPEDDIPYTLPTFQQPNLVPQQDPKIDQRLDIKVHHDPIELRMMEVFQYIDSKSFGSQAFISPILIL
jgi:hypothetical protein